ncbi:MAG: hypothetical protein HQK54_04440 [Oligoflexales bacterium]|nr:hypothetical protein [Oligoflexales bacterium]
MAITQLKKILNSIGKEITRTINGKILVPDISRIIKRPLIYGFIFYLCLVNLNSPCLAETHEAINDAKSKTNNIFFSLTTGIESGIYSETDTAEQTTDYSWSGYGLRGTLGVEFWHFLQLSVSHTRLSMAATSSPYQSLVGSRISPEAQILFCSAFGNIQGAVGLNVNTMDYQQEDLSSRFMGNGFYYKLGLNYFIFNQVSLFFDYSWIYETYKRNGGKKILTEIQTYTNSFGFGISLWL